MSSRPPAWIQQVATLSIVAALGVGGYFLFRSKPDDGPHNAGGAPARLVDDSQPKVRTPQPRPKVRKRRYRRRSRRRGKVRRKVVVARRAAPEVRVPDAAPAKPEVRRVVAPPPVRKVKKKSCILLQFESSSTKGVVAALAQALKDKKLTFRGKKAFTLGPFLFKGQGQSYYTETFVKVLGRLMNNNKISMDYVSHFPNDASGAKWVMCP